MPDVLLVDDDAAVRKMMRIALEVAGLDVVAVGEARVAVEHLRDEPPRLLVTDLFMPDMDGLELLAIAARLAPGMPVLVISGGGRFHDVTPLATAEHMGAVSTLAKPFSVDELVTAVRAAIGDG